MLQPNNIEIEEACLGCAIISEQALLKLISDTTSDDFYYDKCRKVYNCLIELHANKIKIDILSVKNILGNVDPSWLMTLWKATTSPNNIDHYIKTLLEYSTRRKLANIGANILDKVKGNVQSEEIINDFTVELRKFDKQQAIKVIACDYIFDQPEDKFKLHPSDFVKTGIRGFDETFWGLYKSEVVTVAARPSCGKSALALNIAMNVAEKDNVLFFSLEMPQFFVNSRMLSIESNIDSEYIIHDILDKYQRERLNESRQKLAKLKLHFVDKSGIRGNTLDAISRTFDEKNKLGLIVLDYLQIMRNDSTSNRYLQIGEDMKIAKNIARDLNVPIIVISQLGRAVESRTNRIPMLSDLRESGDIENDSDKVIFIYFENDNDEEGRLMIAKNKYGSKGNAPIRFERKYSRFV